MALHFGLMVNGRTIGTVVIQRQEPVVLDDEPNTYHVRTVMYREKEFREAMVEHYYRDGALTLIRKALQAIEGVVQ